MTPDQHVKALHNYGHVDTKCGNPCHCGCVACAWGHPMGQIADDRPTLVDPPLPAWAEQRIADLVADNDELAVTFMNIRRFGYPGPK